MRFHFRGQRATHCDTVAFASLLAALEISTFPWYYIDNIVVVKTKSHLSEDVKKKIIYKRTKMKMPIVLILSWRTFR